MIKNTFWSALVTLAVCMPAMASDGGVYMDTETVTRKVTTNAVASDYNDYARTASRRVVVGHRPCAYASANPVAVKVGTEVIDHYQVYQPVISYVPAGTYTTRRMVAAPRPCGCGK